jgi:Zn-finger nucleic acid-binding protein
MHSETVCGEAIERCGSCGGEFCVRQVLQRLLSVHAPAPGSQKQPYARPSPLSDPVRYRKCPVCGKLMLRKNFGNSSGIIVDVCSAHGTWFDRGELGMVFEFVASGALAAAELESAQRRDERRRLDDFGQRLKSTSPRHYDSFGSDLVMAIDDLADLVQIIADLGN